MHLVDHILVLLLFVVQPVYGVYEARRYTALEKAGRPMDRVGFYRSTALIQWVFLAVLVTAWITLGRSFEDLGFVSPGGPGFWTGATLVVGLIGFLLYAWRAAKRASESEKARQLEGLQEVRKFLPQTARELHNFFGVSITAGIVEEIVYRGFVLWYLMHLMPLWVAVIVASVIFGLGHSYQGISGASRAGLVGLVFGILYVGTGSIWLPIIAHMLLDVFQGGTIYELLRRRSDTMNPRAA